MATAKSHNGLNRGVADPSIPGGAAESEDIRRNIDRTRGEMDRTIDELSDRLRPRNLFDDLVDSVRCSILGSTGMSSGSSAGQQRMMSEQVTDVASRAGKNLLEAVRENPVPAALMGAGLAWLLFEDKAERAYRRNRIHAHSRGYTGNRWTDTGTHSGSYVDARTGEPYDASYGAGYADRDFDGEPDVCPPSMRDKVSGAASGVKSTLGSVAGTVSSAAHTVGNVAGKAVEGVKSLASTTAHAASATGRGVRSAGQAVGGFGRTAGSTVCSTGSSVRDYGGSAVGSVRDVGRSTASSVAGLGRSASEMSQAALERSRMYGRRAGEGVNYGYAVSRERFNDALDEKPLVVGIAALAAGVLAGFALPHTRMEDRTLGRTSDRLKEEARRRSQEALDQGKEVASHLADSALGEVEGAGLTPGSLGEKVARVAKDALSAAQESAQREGLDAATIADKARQVGQAVKEKGKEELKDVVPSSLASGGTSGGSTSGTAVTGASASLGAADLGIASFPSSDLGSSNVSGSSDFGAGLSGGTLTGGDMSSVKDDADTKHDIAEGMSASSEPTTKDKTTGMGDSCSC